VPPHGIYVFCAAFKFGHQSQHAGSCLSTLCTLSRAATATRTYFTTSEFAFSIHCLHHMHDFVETVNSEATRALLYENVKDVGIPGKLFGTFPQEWKTKPRHIFHDRDAFNFFENSNRLN
jgi:hypothetical protein